MAVVDTAIETDMGAPVPGMKRKPAAGFSAQDFLIALAEGKQSPGNIPVPAARKRKRTLVRKDR